MNTNAVPAVMNPRHFILQCMLMLAARACAYGQTAPSSLDGTLVRCGTEQVAVVEGSASKDDRFAAGWTLRPKANQPPVNWSTYHRKDPAAFAAKFNPEGSVDFPEDKYELVNGVLDLTAKTFTPLAGGHAPFYPGEPHSELDATWSEDRHGIRYGVVNNVFGTNHSESTAGLWLVRMDTGGAHVVNLQPGADKAVAGFLRKRDPRDAADYQWTFSSDNVALPGEPAMIVFRGKTLTLHFIAQGSEEARNIDAGFVSFGLSKGMVTNITSDEPFRRAATR